MKQHSFTCFWITLHERPICVIRASIGQMCRRWRSGTKRLVPTWSSRVRRSWTTLKRQNIRLLRYDTPMYRCLNRSIVGAILFDGGTVLATRMALTSFCLSAVVIDGILIYILYVWTALDLAVSFWRRAFQFKDKTTEYMSNSMDCFYLFFLSNFYHIFSLFQVRRIPLVNSELFLLFLFFLLQLSFWKSGI
jgi:hypothetical protein